MESIETVGQKLTGGEERDAIHIAILPVICGEDYLAAGHEVGLVYGTPNTVVQKSSCYGIETIGVIDPFLTDNDLLRKGDVVWCFLKPGTIVGLRHVWAHPTIDNIVLPTDEHEAWLRAFADKWNFDWDGMIGVATQGSIKETLEYPEGTGIEPHTYDMDWITARGRDLHDAGELGDDYVLFWEHLEAFTKQKYDVEHRTKVKWSCTC